MKEIPIDLISRRPPDDPDIAQALYLLKDDLAALFRDHSRYWQVLSVLSKFWVTGRKVRTCAVRLSSNGLHQLLINPAFWISLDEHTHRLAVLCHEVHHIVLGHCQPDEWPKQTRVHQDVFDVACELAANTHVRIALPKSPRPVLPKAFGFPENKTTMEYFRLLLKTRSDSRCAGLIASALRRMKRQPGGMVIREESGSRSAERPTKAKRRSPISTDDSGDRGTDLSVLRAVAGLGDTERRIIGALRKKNSAAKGSVTHPGSVDTRTESDPTVIDRFETPSPEWLDKHALDVAGTSITDPTVFKRILAELVRDATRGYSMGGTFRSRSYSRVSRRRPNDFGCPGVRKTGGGLAAKLDLCLLVDATSSMGPYINNVRQHLAWTAEQLSRLGQIHWRTSVALYRDIYCDSQFFSQHPFTTRVEEIRQQLCHIRPDGGGDAPESVAYGLYQACRRTVASAARSDPQTQPLNDPWRPEARKVLLLVTDAECHLYDGAITVAKAIHAAGTAGVRVYCLGPWRWQPYQRIVEGTKGKLFRVGNG